MRDFHATDFLLSDFLHEQGFVKVDMPDNFVLENMSQWNTTGEYLNSLNRKQRYYVNRFCIKTWQQFDVAVVASPSEQELEEFFQLYLNVKQRSFKLNTFTIPKKLILNMATHPNWEILAVRLKGSTKTVAVSFNYKARNNYAFLAVGLDYDHVATHGVYKQILFQTILRGKALGKQNILVGMDAAQEKRKFGTTVYPKVMYAQIERNFSMEKINLMQIKTN